ncbi:acetyl-CoA-benzylalcohol acetyltransferase-like [Solanum pennellii]|uniref:Acetyl-CoA-benzylalcohol acetyltransferase-like n=1 Tax=Solanum pennellii TaxID=28526 RepID=A0ABM1FRE2_SOLPN|nr:acetyl-CoA-benzylalcohol acetyltransferase-like [Solanum pennellii]
MAFQKENMEIEIISTKFIKPSSPTPNHLQNYKLSFFDQVSDETHLPLVFFYPPTNNINFSSHHEEQLEQSLSRILTHVYPISGRFNEDINSISCQDQGVKFIKAKMNSKLNEFLDKAHKDVNLSLLCWPQDSWNVDPSNLFTMPLVIIQITEFECGGLALSMSHMHMTMDGYSTFNFINEWSKVCRLKIPLEKIDFMSFDLGNVFPTRDLSKLLLPRIPPVDRLECKLVAKRLYINEDSISRLREKVGGDLCKFKPSRVEMIMALLWRAVIRASEKKHGYLRRSLMNIPINLRTRLISLPQVEKSFGNLGVDAPIKFIPGENKMELHEFVTLIHNAVKETIHTCDKTSPEDIVSAVSNIYNESFLAQDWGGNDEVDRIISSSLCKFPIQEADFGWGKPCLMHFGSRHGQVCWLYDAECGNGICVQVDLKEDNMNLFECDNDIKDFFQF